MIKLTPRPYQLQAINRCVEHFTSKSKEHAICVLPTGAGKSLVIACIAEQIEGNVLVLQPSKEILEQNIAKYRNLGLEATIYSAIMGEKKVSKVTFATIGSIITKKEKFEVFTNVLIDECHVVNSRGGMYEHFLTNQPTLTCIGLTATPYRLRPSSSVAVIEFLTRTRPNFFKKVIHVTQQSELKQLGFLSEITYKRRNEIEVKNLLVKPNHEYDETSVIREFDRVNITDLILQEIELFEKTRKSILVFCEFIYLLDKIKAKRPDIFAITGSTDKTERAQILSDFKQGKIKILVNVGVLTTGFDYPALDTIIVAKPTRSLSLWYQIIGRGQRIADGKENCLVVDMCSNLNVLGDVQRLEIVKENHKWVVKQGNQIITNKAF